MARWVGVLSKINSEWIKVLNRKAKTIKLLEKNIGEKLDNLGFDHGLLGLTPKAESTKEKNR